MRATFLTAAALAFAPAAHAGVSYSAGGGAANTETMAAPSPSAAPAPTTNSSPLKPLTETFPGNQPQDICDLNGPMYSDYCRGSHYGSITPPGFVDTHGLGQPSTFGSELTNPSPYNTY